MDAECDRFKPAYRFHDSESYTLFNAACVTSIFLKMFWKLDQSGCALFPKQKSEKHQTFCRRFNVQLISKSGCLKCLVWGNLLYKT